MAAIKDFMEHLDQFETISLEEMDCVKLLDRMDTKFLFHKWQLPYILEMARPDHRVLTINGARVSGYESHYFDTPDYEMYLRHHNGKANRHKVRFRTYLDSETRYFEVKFKNNKGRTVKDRVKVKVPGFQIEGKMETLLREKTPYQPDMLQEALSIWFDRITLVNESLSARITLDSSLNFAIGQETCGFPDLVIAEVKQARSNGSSFISLLHKRAIYPMSLSKYCLGISSLVPDIKKNNLKPKLLYVQKLNHEPA